MALVVVCGFGGWAGSTLVIWVGLLCVAAVGLV